MQLDALTSKGKIGDLEIKNRIVMPPMGVSIGDGSGYITEKEIAYYGSRAKGGVGLIVSACCTVSPELCGVVSLTDPNLSLPESAEHMKPLMEEVHKYGTKMIFQLLHMGRQGSSAINNGQQPVAPSALKEADWCEMPRELTRDEIKRLVGYFISAAKTAFDGGADGVEIHASHGYLNHQFMSPRANHRTDEYGGNFENRLRFITEIIEGIKAIRPKNTIISVRMNARDGYEGGMTAEDCVRIAKYLESIGVDCLNISQATYTNSFMVTEPGIYDEGCRTEQIKNLRANVNIPVIAVNNIKRGETANRLIEEEVCDFVGLGRASLCDPEFGNKAAAGKPETIRSCISCDNCLAFAAEGGHSRCSLNPYLGEESTYNEKTMIKSGQGKTAVIIGGGPGGMNAAELLSAKEYKVVLLEKDSELGGALRLASKGKGKDKIKWTVDGYKARLKEKGIEVKLGAEVKSAEDVVSFNPSVIVVAAGGYPMKPPIAGVDLPHVMLAHDVLRDATDIKGKNIVIVGSGMTGLETAEVLVENGNQIRMYDMLDEIAKGAEPTNKIADMQYLSKMGVSFHPNHKLKEITPDEVVFVDLTSGKEVKDQADIVVLSLGVKSNCALESLKETFDNVIFVGDCVKPGKIVDATLGGFETIWNI